MFDELADGAFSTPRGMMSTDIREDEKEYDVWIDMPGVAKENLQVELKDNYLVVTAKVQREESENKNERYLRQERFAGTVRRSFYVGDKVEQDQIKAKLENGTLHLTVPKHIVQPAAGIRNLITVEE
jgi:HSP20 family molecular chaperone IbpA